MTRPGALRADLADLREHWRRRTPAAASIWPPALAAIAPALAVLADISLIFDEIFARGARALPRDLVDVFQIVTRFGESHWLFALSVLTFVGAAGARASAVTRRARACFGLLAARALYVFVVLADSGLLSQALKHPIGRARPALLDKVGPHHFEFFSLPSIYASFPSGHTITAFATAAALGFFLPRRFKPLPFLAALAIAASRVIIGAHYCSDVLGGALIGLACAYLTALVFARRRLAFTVAPDSFWPRARGSRLCA
ncbi:membrane-associated phospholipid phosphatase [Rhodoblastus sphagnicola]|uniref:phosphatase PAP2 family protein n=1 Tax=Rhodoblastus sphagnicola TaxID=333368 RepID=UPI001304BE4C|nr:phosphatase PAP2 family protein [Rhodoblastus sphagnicola]MBB4197193.1 membrane-associated phospholipid phosphatase [Rhodoblastus sphagnicola]